MIYKAKTLNRGEAMTRMVDWIASNGQQLPAISSEYEEIRYDIKRMYQEVKVHCLSLTSRKDYTLDVLFGLKLKKYLEEQTWFTNRIAADTDFWRYLSVMVVPDIVAERWSFDNEDHYWKKPTRIWLRSIWWYVELTWDVSDEVTKKRLLLPRFNTDTILNLVERVGKFGTNKVLYKRIIQVYSEIPENYITAFKKRSKKSDDLFRAIMRLNTARSIVVEPSFCNGGESGYVKGLLSEFTNKKQ